MLAIILACNILALIAGVAQRRRKVWRVVAWLAASLLLAMLAVLAAVLLTVASGSMG
jgi:hypothetical protein